MLTHAEKLRNVEEQVAARDVNVQSCVTKLMSPWLNASKKLCATPTTASKSSTPNCSSLFKVHCTAKRVAPFFSTTVPAPHSTELTYKSKIVTPSTNV